MHTCKQAYIHTYMYTYTYIYIHTCTHTYMNAYIKTHTRKTNEHTNIQTSKHTHAHTHTHEQANEPTDERPNTHTHARTYERTYIHIHNIHTHVHTYNIHLEPIVIFRNLSFFSSLFFTPRSDRRSVTTPLVFVQAFVFSGFLNKKTCANTKVGPKVCDHALGVCSNRLFLSCPRLWPLAHVANH